MKIEERKRNRKANRAATATFVERVLAQKTITRVVLLVFAPTTSRARTGFRDLCAERKKAKLDLARALVLVAFLLGDLDRGKPGLRGVDEIHTDRG
jgi:hypothetical protein